ncbi:hypothetical protein NXS19_005472 [Fusarium pseudograminearum]|nr:hypothetical protein NXS19_005472 [Fusarium pseudograminearum]
MSWAIVFGSKVILCSAGEKRGNEAAVQKTGRSTCTYFICSGKSCPATTSIERHSLQLQAFELKLRDDLTLPAFSSAGSS